MSEPGNDNVLRLFATQVDERDLADMRRYYMRAYRRRPKAEAIDVTMSASYATLLMTMMLLNEALGMEGTKSVMLQMVKQAEEHINTTGGLTFG